MSKDVLLEPTATDTGDALALLKAYHLNDTLAARSVLTNCDLAGVLKAMTVFAESMCSAPPTDACRFVEGMQRDLMTMRQSTSWGRET